MTKWDAFKKIKKSSPTHSQNILPSQYFISMDIHIWPTYLKSFCPNFFFWKSMAQKYPTYLQFDICQNFRSFFFWDPSLNKKLSILLTICFPTPLCLAPISLSISPPSVSSYQIVFVPTFCCRSMLYCLYPHIYVPIQGWSPQVALLTVSNQIERM